MKPGHHTQVCSFCGKAADQGRRLIAGPGVSICGECVALCNDILIKDWGRGPSAGRRIRCWSGARQAAWWWQRVRPSHTRELVMTADGAQRPR